MTLTFSSLRISSLITLLRGPILPQSTLRPEPQPLSAPEADGARADRAFLHEMMCRHPEAIQSEHGMMMLMALFPKHF